MWKYPHSQKSVQWEPSCSMRTERHRTCLQSGTKVSDCPCGACLLLPFWRLEFWGGSYFFFNSCPTLTTILYKYCSLCTSVRQKKLAAVITTWIIFVYCYRNGFCVFFTVVVILTLRRPALMAVWFRIFSSFLPRACKIVLIFIVCFRYGEETRIDLWNGQNTETAYKYMKT